VTLGIDGSFFQTAEDSGSVPAFSVPTVDATGCGDAFIAGLLCQFISVQDWRDQLSKDRMYKILRYASAVGALTATKQGVIPALPFADQVNGFLSKVG